MYVPLEARRGYRILWAGVKGGSRSSDLGFFLCGHVVFPALLVEDAVFSPMYAFGIFVKY